MTTEAILETIARERGVNRYNSKALRQERDMGFSETDAARVLITESLSNLSELIANRVHGQPFANNLFSIGLDKAALATLSTCFKCVKRKSLMAVVCEQIGRTIEAECWAVGYLAHDEKKALVVEKGVKRKHGSLKYRRQAARSMAARGGYKLDAWPLSLKVKLGEWLLNQLLEACGSIFELRETPHTYKRGRSETVRVLSLTDEALARIETISAGLAQACPMLLPMVEKPDQWTSLYGGGYHDKALKKLYPLVRTTWGNKGHKALLQHAIRNGSMKPVLEAVNAIQNVAFTINPRILSLLLWVQENHHEVAGLPRFRDFDPPAYPDNWEELGDEEKRHWRKKGAEIKAKNIGLIGQRVVFSADLETACLLGEQEFYIPQYVDFRGRIYGMSHFNFQRGDYVRALFKFAKGKPIGEIGYQWLAIHLANCGDFEKVSKKSYDDRLQWVNDHLDEIVDVATNPQDTIGWWSKADKPFLFVAACMEYLEALIEGPTYVSHLPVSFDGSCSGLQHLCAMTASLEGRFVNLTPSEAPQDVYQAVADRMKAQVTKDAEAGNEMAQAWLRYGIGRKEVKRGVMTYCYSSRSFGMSDQIVEDLMVPLADEVLSGKREVHPFGEGQGYKEAFYLGTLLCKEIEEFIHAPAEAMGFLRKLALSLAHEKKPVTWVTPVGLPVVSWYPEVKDGTIKLWLHDKGVRTPVQVRVDIEPTDNIKKEKSANGVAPNFVHSMDAAHLMMVVNAALSEDITQFALVHDSFGCLAADADRWNAIIREQFARLYTEFDVLEDIRNQTLKDISVANVHRVPDAPAKGDLDVHSIKESLYAFA